MTWQAAATNPAERIIIALDVAATSDALALIRRLSPHPGFFKVGFQLFTAGGPEVVRAICGLGSRVFLDLKLHDIPNTVRAAVESAASLGASMLTLHLSGGRAMIEAAAKACPPELLLLGVTVLTSSDEQALRQVGITASVEEQVLRLARLGIDSGIHGLVASANEAAMLRQNFGPKITLVAPGIRPSGTSAGDQKRTSTPAAAIAAGADYLVIGRPIIAAADPRAALDQVIAELSG